MREVEASKESVRRELERESERCELLRREREQAADSMQGVEVS